MSNLKYNFHVEKQHLQVALSILTFATEVINLVDKSIKIEALIKYGNTNINIEYDFHGEQDKHKSRIILSQYGEVLAGKHPMNHLFGEDGDAIILLKQMLDVSMLQIGLLENDKIGDERQKALESQKAMNELMKNIGENFIK